MNKSTLYFIANSLTLFYTSLLLYKSGTDVTSMVILVLSSLCVFIFQHLLVILNKNKKLLSIILACSVLFYAIYNPKNMFPVIIILTYEVIDIYFNKSNSFQIIVIIFLIMIFLFEPNLINTFVSANILAIIICSGYAFDKLDEMRKTVDQQKEEIARQGKKIADIKSYTSTLKDQVALEERNRFAGRIHDQLGHGISGSIILLEAALMTMKDNPEKAEESIQKSVDCLRKGVDDIRMSLREERPKKLYLGINHIKSILQEFELTYNIKTELSSNGDLKCISTEMWQCVIENLEESLTNMLKHSSGNLFTVNIDIYNKILKIKFADNGKCSGVLEKGIGLDAIEERTAKCGGKCLVSCGQNGFSLIQLFNI